MIQWGLNSLIKDLCFLRLGLGESKIHESNVEDSHRSNSIHDFEGEMHSSSFKVGGIYLT